MASRARRKAILAGLNAFEATPAALCPGCSFQGQFAQFGLKSRPGALCPQCGSLERHRLLWRACEDGFVNFYDKRVLHFAPERIITAHIEQCVPAEYLTADIQPGRDLLLDIEAIEQPDDVFDIVVCSHVLKHVDDRKALSEFYRILRPGGSLVCMVPVIEGWSESLEDPTIRDEKDRLLYFGQSDHVRRYGADFRKRIASAGLQVEEFTTFGTDAVHHGLTPGDKVFRADKLER